MKSAIKPACILALLAIIFLLQKAWDLKKPDPYEALTNPLPSKIIKSLDLGLDSAAAALLWLNVIQEIGHIGIHANAAQNIKTINELDPKFSYPYAFAALMLPSANMAEQAIEIGNLGIKQAEPDWQIPFYLGVTYHIYLNDRKNAALNFDLAANTKNAPDSAKIISSNYGSNPDKRSETKMIWLSIYENSDDEVVKQRAQSYLTQMEILDLLEKASQIYKRNFQKYPSKIYDLVEAGILKKIPEDPFGLKYYINEQGIIEIKT